MSVLDTAMVVFHLLFAGLWTGAVVFVTWSVLPLAGDGDVGPTVLETVAGRLTTLSRVSALVLLASGGHLAGARYTTESLTGTGRGHLVLTMVGLWFALAALVEVGSSRLVAETNRGKVRTPARKARPFYLAATAASLLLLVVAGLLQSNLV